MKLKALDSFYTDETKTISDGQVFEVRSAAFGNDLIERGLAREEKAAKGSPSNKDAGAPAQNKAAK